jgi:hypothetical protein
MRLLVLCAPAGDGERFALIRPDTLVAGSLPWGSIEAWQQAFLDVARDATWITEERLRAELFSLGLSPDDVEDHVDRARHPLWFRHDGTAASRAARGSWIRATTIGFENRHAQQVLQKTDRPGAGVGQRLFVLRCGACGHEHMCDGCDIDERTCPRCRSAPIPSP